MVRNYRTLLYSPIDIIFVFIYPFSKSAQHMSDQYMTHHSTRNLYPISQKMGVELGR